MSENRNYVIFRIGVKSAPWKKDFLLDKLLNHGLLLQGWGSLDNRLTKEDGSFKTEDEFCSGRNSDNIQYYRNIYKQLIRMKRLNVGDLIVVPIPWDRYFYTMEVSSAYSFREEILTDPQNQTDDFGHCIGVRNIRGYTYDNNNTEYKEAGMLSNTFRSYRSPINFVYVEEYQKWIEYLAIKAVYDEKKANETGTSKSGSRFMNIWSQTAEDLLAKIGNRAIMTPDVFEDLVERIFLSAGYLKHSSNIHAKGKDIDRLFKLSYPLLDDANLANDNPTVDTTVYVAVQIKQKEGLYTDESCIRQIDDIEELLAAKANVTNAKNVVRVIVSSCTEFSDSIKQAADRNSILLIDGKTLSRMALQYMSPKVLADSDPASSSR